MLQLTRQVRCFWPLTPLQEFRPSNRWASLTPIEAFQPLLTIEVSLAGPPCSQSGFIVNIRDIDECVATVVEEVVRADAEDAPKVRDHWQRLSNLGAQIQSRFVAGLPDLAPAIQLAQCRLLLSPQVRLEFCPNPTPSALPHEKGSIMGIILTQQFEFSAAHRLNCEDWSPEENARVFGKCNYPSGHGHNYLLDVSISHLEKRTPEGSDVQWLSNWVQQHVLNRLDHRFLNWDVPEFQELNPTVENIAQVIFTWLSSELPSGYRLEKVRVFETAKTWADCFERPVSG